VTADVVVLGTEVDEVRQLADGLGAAAVELVGAAAWRGDPPGSASGLTDWRERVALGTPAEAVVVAMWAPARDAAPLVDLDDDAWGAAVESAIAGWVAGLGAAVRRCADGGRVVAAFERPAPLDAAGRVVESGVADAVEALVRSLARSEGARSVRVNGVSTPLRLVPERVVAPAPPLASFPGSVSDVVEAVRMLLGPGVSGVTGTVVHADCGRSWR
jgi:NAD(P)-dependent dehydrogenase (short-subunit alcohol dehydrogenase family)